MNEYRPIEVAIALSLYGFNVSPTERAERLHRHFRGRCMEFVELFDLLMGPRAQYAATELPYPTARVYVEHALDRYGPEAKRRAAAEEGAWIEEPND